jgi:uncharacterized protein
MERQAPIPFHTFLWKTASRCNLNCSYCFVYNLEDQLWQLQPGLMSARVATQTARRMREHCERHGKEDVLIVFHGGEPLLGGVRHLEMLLAVIDAELGTAGIRVSLGMQSNGLLFTEEIGDLCLSRGMTIGVSVDGPPRINDRYRVDHQNRPSSQRLEEKLALLTSSRYQRVFSGFLCVMNLAHDPLEVTEYLYSWHPPNIDYLFPLCHHDRPPTGKEHDPIATPYADWLITCFDRWLASEEPPRVRLFGSILALLFGRPSCAEFIGLDPVDLIVVETDGSIEALDALKATFEGATKLGFDVFRHDFDTVALDLRIRARQLGATALCATCQSCSLVDVCGGGYLPHRYASRNGFDNPSVYCTDLQKLIGYIRRRVVTELAPSDARA